MREGVIMYNGDSRCFYIIPKTDGVYRGGILL